MRLLPFCISILCLFTGCATSALAPPQAESDSGLVEEIKVGGEIQIRTQHQN